MAPASGLALVGTGVACWMILRPRTRRRVVTLADLDAHAEEVDAAEVEEDEIVRPTGEDRLERIAELLDDNLSFRPRPGYFYPIVKGDTMKSVARRALETLGPCTEATIVSYIHSIGSGQYNIGRYGTRSTTKSFPATYLVPCIKQGIRVAFQPRNVDAVAAMREGTMPKMVVDQKTGAPLPGSCYHHYGLIWLPPVDAKPFEDGIITCAGYSWEDGSSTIDPDPELMALLEAA